MRKSKAAPAELAVPAEPADDVDTCLPPRRAAAKALHALKEPSLQRKLRQGSPAMDRWGAASKGRTAALDDLFFNSN